MEVLDLVSHDDEVVGQISREKAYAENCVHFRTVNGFVINEDFELWIPQRHKTKELWPLLLDASMGGHVKCGESYEEALIREASEELNIDLTKVPYKPLGKITPLDSQVGSFMMIYLIFYSRQILFNPDDFVWGEWYELDNILNLLKKSNCGKPDLLPILEWMSPELAMIKEEVALHIKKYYVNSNIDFEFSST